MQTEINSLHAAGTYEVVKLPPGRHAIGGKWVYRTKRGANGEITKYKARWVAQGFSQKHGVDYTDTFAPVARFDSIRGIMALAAQHNWELHQMDVRSAYLNGELEEEIYMQQPTGFATSASAFQQRSVCRLRKSLYGLKQSGRTWTKRGSVVLIISLYVDDLLLASDNLNELIKVKAELSSRFDMEDMGEASFVLGIKITRDRAARTLTISQGAYIEEMLTTFGMDTCQPVSTPMDSKTRLVPFAVPTTSDSTTNNAAANDLPPTSEAGPKPVLLDAAAKTKYQSAVGALLHAARATRPDISYAVTALSQFCKEPASDHWSAVKRLFRYLRGSAHRGLIYKGTGPSSPAPLLFGYCDSDWAEDRYDRRSFTGYAFLISGAAVSWACRKQTTVALSSTEAEYMSSADAAREAIWWRSFLSSLTYPQQKPTLLLSDNQGSIQLSKNPEGHRRTKHIDVRHHYIRERVHDETIIVDYVNTAQMAADVLTKPLAAVQHGTTIKLLGMIDTPTSTK
jgi:hypothetical protein